MENMVMFKTDIGKFWLMITTSWEKIMFPISARRISLLFVRLLVIVIILETNGYDIIQRSTKFHRQKQFILKVVYNS